MYHIFFTLKLFPKILGLFFLTVTNVSGNDTPGVTYSDHYDSEIPCSLHVLTIDFSDPAIRMAATLPAENDRQTLAGRQKLSQMAGQLTTDYNKVGGINADFFSFDTSYPVNLHVSDHLPATPNHQRAVFGAAGTDSLFIDQIDFQAELKAGENEFVVDQVNPVRALNEPALYSSFYGEPFHTDSTGKALAFEHTGEGNFEAATPELIDGEIYPEDHDLLITLPNSSIDANTATLELKYDPLSKPVVEAVGGGPELVRDGEVVVDNAAESEGIGRDFVETRHPRTAVGFNHDQSELYLATADGRSEESAGMDLYELAEFMISLGADHALNLDGGGSTTMVWDGEILNQPSDDDGERPVANGLLIIVDE